MGATRPASVFQQPRGATCTSAPSHLCTPATPNGEAAENCPDARRVAPISACVSYQINRLKSRFETMERTVMPGNCALMGATRPASVFSATSGTCPTCAASCASAHRGCHAPKQHEMFN